MLIRSRRSKVIKPRINVEVDPDLKRKAQMKAFREGETLTTVIVRLIKKWLKQKGE